MRQPRLLASPAFLVSCVLALVAAACHGGGSGGGGSGGSAGGSASGCHSYTDCSSPDTVQLNCETSDPCVGDTAPCAVGDQPPQACNADADCGAGSLCDACDMSSSVCRPKCTSDAGCDPGATCDATGRCVRKTCTAAADCPDNFTCTAGGCVRKPCSADGDCKGACVYGRCVEAIGFCVACGP